LSEALGSAEAGQEGGAFSADAGVDAGIDARAIDDAERTRGAR